MTTTLLQLRTAVRYAVNELTAALWTDAELNILLNNAVRDIARRAEVIQSFNTSITALAGTAKYSLPTDIVRVHRVEFVPTGQTQTYPLQASTYVEMDQNWGVNQSWAGAYPQYFVIFGTPGFSSGANKLQIQVWPVPSQGGTLNLFYYRVPTTMAADGDIAEIPEGWQDAVVLYAEGEAKRKNRDPSWVECKRMYEEKLSEMLEVTRRYHDQGAFITSGSGSMVPGWLYGNGEW